VLGFQKRWDTDGGRVLDRLARMFGRGRRRYVERIELHVSHACNLACESCSHYSNHAHKGHLAPQTAAQWMAPWSRRLAVDELSLLGGEPTINPQLCDLIRIARRHFPRTRIRLITNGFFLDRHPDLGRTLVDVGNSYLAMSIHHDAADYRARIAPALAQLETWRRDHGLDVVFWDSHANWTRRYHGFGDGMLPFEDGRPRQSWETCLAKHCKQLHEGKLWKCAPLAYLGMQDAKFQLSEKWRPYLAYQPLAPDCTDDELDAFLAREEDPQCAMCSAELRPFALPNPLRRPTQTAEAAE